MDPKANPRRLYLRDLPEFVGEKELLAHLSSYGKIDEVKVLQNCAFVQFSSDKDAKDVLDTFKDSEFLGKMITIEPARLMRKDMPPARFSIGESLCISTPSTNTRRSISPRRPSPRYPVIVTNIPKHICWQELKDFGRKSGCRVVFCDRTIRRGEGFIEFGSAKDAERAVYELDGRNLGGRLVDVFLKGSRPPRRHEGSRSRSRSPAPRYSPPKSPSEYSYSRNDHVDRLSYHHYPPTGTDYYLPRYREEEAYGPRCMSTYHRDEHEGWNSFQRLGTPAPYRVYDDYEYSYGYVVARDHSEDLRRDIRSYY